MALKFLIGCAILLCLVFDKPCAQHFTRKDEAKVSAINQALAKYHIDYHQLSGKFKGRFPSQLITMLDPEGTIFTLQEANSLKEQAGLLGQLSGDGAAKLMDSCYARLSHGYQRSLQALQSINTIDFFAQDSVFVSYYNDTVAYATSFKAFQQVWERQIKRAVLSRKFQDTLIAQMPQPKANQILNEQAKNVIQREICRIEGLAMTAQLSKHIREVYGRAVTTCFDPHSEYFSIDEQSAFINSLSSETLGTGLIVSLEKGKYLIKYILPFSPASEYTGQIAVGDEIEGVYINGQIQHPACMAPGKLYELLDGSSTRALTLEIRSSKDNTIGTYTLPKRQVSNIENHTFAYILEGSQQKIGYIGLPVFYADLFSNGRSAGQDIALIILKMKKQKINGLVIDLRDNGGGSLEEALDLCGFFVDYGPLLLSVSQNHPNGFLHKDGKRGRLYDGKMMFMVNGYSASAAEMLAAAVRPYPNALVVGGQTFGKSTGQESIPLYLPGQSDPFGFVKLTTFKIYGIDGQSYQGQGLTPDLPLPGTNEKLFSESNYPYALQLQPIAKKFVPTQQRNVPLSKLKEAQKQRHPKEVLAPASKGTFLAGDRTAEFYLPLAYPAYKKFVALANAASLPNPHCPFDIKPIEEDDNYKQLSQQLEPALKQDRGLAEVWHIFSDWDKQTKN